MTLLTMQKSQQKSQIQGVEEMKIREVEEIVIKENKEVLKAIKSDKHPEPENISIKLLKCVTHALLEHVREIFTDCLIGGRGILLGWNLAYTRSLAYIGDCSY